MEGVGGMGGGWGGRGEGRGRGGGEVWGGAGGGGGGEGRVGLLHFYHSIPLHEGVYLHMDDLRF